MERTEAIARKQARCKLHSGNFLCSLDYFGPLGLFGGAFVANEHLDFLKQRGEQVFFLEAGSHVFSAVYRAVAGHDNHRHLGMVFVHPAGQLHTIHAFHAEVGDQDVEVFFIEFLQRIFAVVGAYRPVALHFLNFTTESCQYLMVIDEEDGFHGCLLRLLQGQFGWYCFCCRPSARYGWPNSFVSEFLGKDALPWLILRFFTGRVPRISHPGKTPVIVYDWAPFRECWESSIAARLRPEGRGAETPHRT